MIGVTDYLQQRAGHAGLGHRVRGVWAHGARHPHPHCLLHSSQNVTNITNDLYNQCDGYHNLTQKDSDQLHSAGSLHCVRESVSGRGKGSTIVMTKHQTL